MSPVWLERLARHGVRPGLERIRELLARLGNPERALRVVLVGGSNGKGSTARALAAVMGAAGRRVGLYTSPHLVSFRERVEVDGRAIPAAAVERLAADLRPHVEAVGATYFEAVTALALAYFAEEGVELAVLEVGLGGRFDAVNATEPELSLVTGLSLEHTEWLGPTLARIAREKAGIFRPGRPALTSAGGEAARLLAAGARQVGAELEFVQPQAVATAGYGVDFSLDRARYHGALMGRFQAANLALAARAATLLGAGPEALRRGLAGVRHPGRLDYRPRERLLYDGAHNPAGAQALAQALDDYFPTSPKNLVFAVSRDKDVESMARSLRPRFARVWLTAYPGARSRNPEELAGLFPGAALEPDPGKALAGALAARESGGLVVVAGSLYLVGALLRLRAGREPEERFQ
ncbi:bifunctional folylpolyglutamate synthase/dihydrofolate synthase [Oceanithermus sp.]